MAASLNSVIATNVPGARRWYRLAPVGNLRVDRHDHVTVFTLDRPEKRNAYDDETKDAIGDAFVAFDADPDQYVGIVTGAGDAFCSGNDLSTPSGGRISTGHRRFPLTDMFGVGATTKPVIAAVNGLAVAGGCEIAWRATSASRPTPRGSASSSPSAGSCPGAAIQLLPRMLNYGDASWMLLTAARVDADDALRIGLVQQVVPAAKLMDVTIETAQGMCELSQVSLQMIKSDAPPPPRPRARGVARVRRGAEPTAEPRRRRRRGHRRLPREARHRLRQPLARLTPP